MHPFKAPIKEHKQFSAIKMLHVNCNENAIDSDYLDLTSDSGEDSDSDDEETN